MSTQNALKILEEAAEKMREAMKRLPLPQNDMSLNEAFQALAASLGDNYFHLELKVSRHSQRSKPHVKYTVWDGNKHHEGLSIRAAVTSCLAIHNVQEQAIEDADAILAQATAEAANDTSMTEA